MKCTRCGDDRSPANLMQIGDEHLCPEHCYADAVRQYQAQQLAPHRPELTRTSDFVVVDVVGSAARRLRAPRVRKAS